MSLAVYQGAMKAMFRLPKKEQKSLEQFISKFNHDSTSAAIHLEPISTFKDSMLRTARISQKYRAVLRAPDVGDVYTLLWVDNHDEAYRWAENKKVDWNPRTESFQVYSIPREPQPQKESTGSDELKVEPVQPEDLSAFAAYNDEQLQNLGVPEPLLPSVKAVKDDTDLNGVYDYLPIEALESLSMLLNGSDYDTLYTSILAGKSGAEDLETQQESANNRSSFIRVENDEQLEQMINGDLALWQLYLHREQRALVELTAKGPTKVTGGAGTGKTVAALHRAKWLQENGEATGDQGILFTTYTKALAKNLQGLMEPMGLRKELVSLTNIDQLALDLYRRHVSNAPLKVIDYLGRDKGQEVWEAAIDDAGIDNAFGLSFLETEYREIKLFNDLKDAPSYYRVSRVGRGKPLTRRHRMAVWELFEAYETYKHERHLVDKYELMNAVARRFLAQTAQDLLAPIARPFRHIIADEVQDFSNVELRMLRALAPEASNDLFLVGDPFQRIYSGKVVFSQAGINIRGRRSKQLRLNYRTTEAIRRYAVKIVEGQSYDDFDGGEENLTGYRSLRLGELPKYEVYRDDRQEAEAILEKVEAYLAEKQESGTLQPRDVVVAFRSRGASKTFRTLTHERDIPVYDLTDTNQGTGSKQGIRLCTLHSLKGLEFKLVFLGGISDGTWPARLHNHSAASPDEIAEKLRLEQSLLYVGITRAIWRAEVSGVGEKCAGLG